MQCLTISLLGCNVFSKASFKHISITTQPIIVHHKTHVNHLGALTLLFLSFNLFLVSSAFLSVRLPSPLCPADRQPLSREQVSQLTWFLLERGFWIVLVELNENCSISNFYLLKRP